MSNDITLCIFKKSSLPKKHIIERYLKFINYCKTIEFKGYTETHHIIPSSFNGSELYTTFTKNTLTIINDDVIISNKFASIHAEFLPHIGKTFAEYGIIKKKRK